MGKAIWVILIFNTCYYFMGLLGVIMDGITPIPFDFNSHSLVSGPWGTKNPWVRIGPLLLSHHEEIYTMRKSTPDFQPN